MPALVKWAGYTVSAVDATEISRPGSVHGDARIHARLRLADLKYLQIRSSGIDEGETFCGFDYAPGELVGFYGLTHCAAEVATLRARVTAEFDSIGARPRNDSGIPDHAAIGRALQHWMALLSCHPLSFCECAVPFREAICGRRGMGAELGGVSRDQDLLSASHPAIGRNATCRRHSRCCR